MKNKSNYVNIGKLIGVTLIAFTVIACFRTSLFEREDTLMAKININSTIVNIVYVQSGATTKDVIQIYVEDKDGNRILKNIENNDFLLGYRYINDSTFSVIVNKGGAVKNKPDTIVVLMK